MIDVLVPGSRLNSVVVILIAYIPHFVVDMKNMAAAVIGYLSANCQKVFYSNTILNL